MSSAQPQKWAGPQPTPDILPATMEQASEYMTWFVNRRAYTCQKHRPDPNSGKYFFYQAWDRKTKEPLSLDTAKVQNHLQGRHTIGLYAINPVTQCSKWVAIDADYEGAYRDLRTLKWELEQDGVHAAVEMSPPGSASLDSSVPSHCRLSSAVSISITSPSAWMFRSKEHSNR